MSMHAKRLDAYWYRAQAGVFLDRFFERPDDARLQSLMQVLREYRAEVEAGNVKPPRSLG